MAKSILFVWLSLITCQIFVCFPNSLKSFLLIFNGCFVKLVFLVLHNVTWGMYKGDRLGRERLHWSRDFKTTRMKKIAVLILAFSCCLCEAQVNENNDKVYQCLGSTSCCDVCSLTSITQNLGAMGEKVTNMAEKITLLEAKLQNTEKDVLELRSLTGGRAHVFMGYNHGI